MHGELLLDTGAFVALVDRSETRHSDCVEVLEHWSGPVVTTEAVLTETLYLVGPEHKGQETCLEFFIRGAFLLMPLSIEGLRRISALMRKYRDLPMDFADASLVVLAEELATDNVFTLDVADFSVYRLPGKRPFKIYP
jgi:predicted nucleic acid-binding protein